MSVVPSPPIPAGWYPDPAGSFQQRWWTGSSWTNDFAQYRPTLIHSAPAARQIAAAAPVAQPSTPAYIAQQAAATVHSTGPVAVQTAQTQTLVREVAVDPLPAFRLPEADQPPQTSVAQPNAGNAALVAIAPVQPHYSVPASNPTFQNDYQPFGSVPQVRRGNRFRPERRFTPVVWVLALLPVLFVGAAYAVATYLPLLYTAFAVGILGAVFLVIGLPLAFADRRMLHRAGHDSTSPPALALLTPLLYLLPRAYFVARETGRSGAAPLIVALVGILGVAAALILVSGLLPLLTTFAAL